MVGSERERERKGERGNGGGVLVDDEKGGRANNRAAFCETVRGDHFVRLMAFHRP